MALSSLDAVSPTLPDRRLEPPERPAPEPKVETPITAQPEQGDSVDRRARAPTPSARSEATDRDPRDEAALRDRLEDQAVQIARSEAGYERIRDAEKPQDARKSFTE